MRVVNLLVRQTCRSVVLCITILEEVLEPQVLVEVRLVATSAQAAHV